MAGILGTTNEKKDGIDGRIQQKKMKREKYDRKYTERDIIT